MSEVKKRDAKSLTINKLVTQINALSKDTLLTDLKVFKRELDSEWNRFQTLHEEVLARAGKTELDEQDKQFNLVYDVFLKGTTNLDRLLDGASAEKSSSTDDSQRHQAIARLITNLEILLDKQVTSMTAAGAKTHLSNMTSLYGKYQDEIVLAIMAAENDEDSNDIIGQQGQVSDCYARAIELLQQVIQAGAAPIAPSTSADLPLPAIQIASFDGSPENWESFKQSFEHIIHLRQSLPAIHKLQHLKSCLHGEAAELIANFSLTNDNYEAAWTLVKQRYENPYELTRAHLRILTSMQACRENADDLRKLMNRTSSTVLALRNLRRPVDTWDDWIVFLVSEKLDLETRKLWEQRHTDRAEFPTWANLEQFLENRVRTLTAVANIKPSSYSNSGRFRNVRSHLVSGRPSTPPRFSCPCCQEEHAIYMCHAFRQLNPIERRNLVEENELCFNCLDSRHSSAHCHSSQRCRFCGQLHNSLLHLNDGAEQTVSSNHSSVGPVAQVLLATAIVRLRSKDGSLHEFRALLDQGSQASFITERAAQFLNLAQRRVDCQITGIGDTPSGRTTHATTVELLSRFGDHSFFIDALVLRKVSNPIALTSDTVSSWPHIIGLDLADPHYAQQQKIDLLIGAELYGSLLIPNICKGPSGSPVAQQTKLGWIISGPTHATSLASRSRLNVHFSAIDIKVDECLERFWTVEEELEPRRIKTKDEEMCETIFEQTMTRDDDGRCHVRIPFQNTRPQLGDSLQMAIKRQHQMERKFIANPTFASEYRKFMSQYLDLGHMKLVGNIQNPIHQYESPSHYYIPHHAVLKESSSTTKLRVVFDASRRSSNGLSLNEQMLPGPRLQDDLTTIVMRWRKHRVVFTADVERMYRQIRIDEPDANLQRIVWRPTSTEIMQIYQLGTVTYGTTSAPYLAVKSLQTVAELERVNFPIGCEIALRDFYVDDVLTGFDDIESALIGQEQLQTMMASGGFALKKWASNSSTLLSHLPAEHCECRLPLELHLDQHIKTLGLQWNPVTDQFSFRIQFHTTSISASKREFLSDAARLYDPLGWLAPCIILVKIMFQQLWQIKLGWDDQLPPPLATAWANLRTSFDELQHLRINRWISTLSTSKIELHGFCDSSIKAYSAAVYVRTTFTNGTTTVQLLCAKTKVAPLKTISLPRLELCGALLLCQLMQNVHTAMQFTTSSAYLWTDSTIVLAWIQGSPTRWSVFVANRIAKIQRLYPIRHWRHVPTKDNPADCATRGVSPAELNSHNLWWNGPDWLQLPSERWPLLSTIADTIEEAKVNIIAHSTTLTIPWELKHRYSSLNRLIRVTAYCIRFIKHLRTGLHHRETGPLTTDELQASQHFWINDAQNEHFRGEITCLKKEQPLRRSSKLRSLNPTIQSDGLIHVGGRLVNSMVLPEQYKMPIIIPRRCKLAELLVHNAHISTLHGGPSLMLAHLRRRFWIIDGPKHVRQFVKKCNTCFRFSSSLGQQMMAALPAARVTPSRPFSHTAMDYSGAVMIRSAKGRGQHATKGYISVFVCLVTKAVHIEIVSDLTSVAFIAAYKRFTGRRGICSDIYSDNATNYVGAAAIFTKTERDLGFNKDVISSLAMMGTKWHFSPPLSPHFNGLAESAIRSVKHHVRRIIGDSTLTYEELSTFLVQVECCLNSRPLYPMSSDPSDFHVLTPAHFLIGSAISTVPERHILDANPNLLTRWQTVQRMLQRFWVQWSAEYLHTLQQRKKWQHAQPNFAVGDMVLITDDNLPPSSWSLGRITEVHPGPDGNIRVVTVRSARQTLKRSIVKLARLPTQDQAN